MQKVYKVAIVGGGASGLMHAITLFKNKPLKNGSVVILEKNDRIGKKLLATGNGQCNLTNSEIKAENYSGNKKFIQEYIKELTNINLIDYLYKTGIPTVEKEEGKIYPLSRTANSVLDTFRSFLEGRAEIMTSTLVKDVIKEDLLFRIKTDKGDILCENVVLAFGGKAGRQFGTDGSSYGLAQKFGHKLTELYPSLVQLKTEREYVKGLKGIKEEARVSALDFDKPLMSAVGDVLFTDYGVSGSAVFKVSSKLSGVKNPNLIIEFLPEVSIKELEKIISDKLKYSPLNKDEILTGIVNKQLGKVILKSVKGQITPSSVAYAVKNFMLKVLGTLDFDYAQVTHGGIVTDSVNPTTFESKLCKNLYLTGELLNVDGDCGGYNLTFAFASGILSALHVLSK